MANHNKLVEFDSGTWQWLNVSHTITSVIQSRTRCYPDPAMVASLS